LSVIVDDVEGAEASRRRSRWRGIVAPFLATAGVVALTFGGLWIVRAPIAENLIGRELDARDVRMTYRIASIGLRTQRIEDVVLGDPRRPDLTARWVEVDVAIAGISPTVAAVRAGGVRLRGSLVGGRLSLGELDKFMGQGGSTEALLPDLRVDLSDARASLASDYGAVGVVLDGRGNLRRAFEGRAVLAVPRLRAGDCGGTRAIADVRIRMRDGVPKLTGPITADAIACPEMGLSLAAPRVDIDATLDERLSSVKGTVRLVSAAGRAGGLTLGRIEALLDGKADGKGFGGQGRIGGGSLHGPGIVAGASSLAFRFSGAGRKLLATGALSTRDVAARGRDPLAGLSAGAAGTPVAPLVAKLSQAVRAAGRGNSLSAALALTLDGARGSAGLSDLRFAARSGAHLAMPDGGRAAISWPDRRWSFAGGVTLGGGGLPQGALSLAAAPGGGVSGTLDVQPYAAGNARLALSPVRFTAVPGGVSRFATHMVLDGPLADGGVRGVSMPLSGTLSSRGALTLNPNCVPLRWDSLRIATLALDRAALGLCPVEGGAMLRIGAGRTSGGAKASAVALGGRIGSSPLQLTAAEMAFGLSRSGFRAKGVEARFGDSAAPVLVGAQQLEGLFAASGIGGTFAGGHGRIGTVPLNLGEMAGRWRFAGGRLDVDGGMRIADTETASPRFTPVLAPDAHMVLADGRIVASATLRHPTRGGPFAKVDITHTLSSGVGEARFALENLRFGSALQPDDLTPMALGVVANVEGAVTGGAAIRWAGNAVTSKGSFTTENMNLAAAFGPVEGLATTLNFTDLLAIQTAPGQVATIRSINPGVEVRDGRVLFQLQPGNRARVEGGEWPFAGGRLTLRPSTLDFDAKGARHLIFRVTGLDAGAFINTMELKNISATGTYDGLLPMVFDASGGRIAGGILVARQEGMPPLLVENAQTLTVPCDPLRQAGTLSYVGDVSNADMGTYGKLAFDVLKKLRYKCLTILLDGAVDGEFVTRLAINGVNQGTEEARKSVIGRSFLGLPFIFNVRIEAPFRGLLNTYQSFVDPSALIRGSLGPQFQTVLENKLAVQPPDSEKRLNKEGE